MMKLAARCTSGGVVRSTVFARPSHLSSLPSSSLRHTKMVGVRTVWRHTQERRDLKQKQKKQHDDPFRVLGIPKGTDYTTVKRTFIKIAMDNHPDTSAAESEEERTRHREIFMAARKAFEKIVEGPGGQAILRPEEDSAWEEEELNEWFHQESGGFDMPFMDIKTRREVSKVMDEIGGGLDRDGGMWQLARTIANENKNGGDGASVLRLEAGDIRSREINGVLRRRRRR